MALTNKSVKVGQRVQFDEHDCVVLEVKSRTLTIRNKFGFPEEIPRKGVKLADKK